MKLSDNRPILTIDTHKYQNIINFVSQYAELAPNTSFKKFNLKRFNEIGLDERKFKIHLSLNRRYFLTQISDEISYFKSYLRLNENADIEFYKVGIYGTGNIKQYGLYRITVPDNIVKNFYKAKLELYTEKGKIIFQK